MIPPPNDWDVLSPSALSSGYAQHATNIEWYTNGEMVTGSTGMIRKKPDNKLYFLHLSRSLGGVYQIFYSNGDLTTVSSLNIFATAGPGKIFIFVSVS